MIDVIDLHKSFNGQKVLDGINLKIPTGRITVIIGPSGCGKTSILRHIIGLLHPDKGKVLVDKTDVNALNRLALNEFRRKFGMLFQHGALFDSMNVYQNVSFPLMEHTKMKKPQMDRIVANKLKLVGLEGVERKMPSELSGGMKKRVGLARAIVLEPEIILYDEPTTGLDPIMAETIDNLILEMQRSLKITSVVISHDITSTFHIADQIAMVYQGKVVAAGTPEQFRKSPHPAVQEFLEKGGAK